MHALILAGLLAAGAPSQASAPDRADLRCYALMAELARSPDPAVRSLGLAAAQYFLGRIDAAAPGTDVRSVSVTAEERPALVRSCGQRLDANGFDLRALGASLGGPEPTV